MVNVIMLSEELESAKPRARWRAYEERHLKSSADWLNIDVTSTRALMLVETSLASSDNAK
jgi:hypothetical protein